MVPASIRYKNPGAMWPGAIPTKWGSTRWIYLNDGTGQGGGGHGNKIAIFDTWVDGICAQLDLWRTSPNYRNKRFADAINIWDGHNHTESYIAYVTARVPGMTRDTVMDDAFWAGPLAIPFLKAQSGHEAGQTIPAPEEDWLEAQRRVMSGKAPPVTKARAKVTKPAIVVSSGAAAGAAAHAAGASHTVVALIVVAVCVIAIGAFIIHSRAS